MFTDKNNVLKIYSFITCTYALKNIKEKTLTLLTFGNMVLKSM